jgi:hypothetical protein
MKEKERKPFAGERLVERTEGKRCGQCGRGIDHAGCCGYQLTECLRAAQDEAREIQSKVESLVDSIKRDLKGEGLGASKRDGTNYSVSVLVSRLLRYIAHDKRCTTPDGCICGLEQIVEQIGKELDL